MNNSRDSRSGKVVVSSFCWDAPFSRWLLVLCRALVWGEPWRDRLGVMTNDLMDWVGGEPESAELVIVLDRFDQDVRSSALQAAFGRLWESLGYQSLERDQLLALLALYMLRDSQTDDELLETVRNEWKLTDEFELTELPSAVTGLIYGNDLLEDGVGPYAVAGMMRAKLAQDKEALRDFKEEVLFSRLARSPWILPCLRCAQASDLVLALHSSKAK